LQFFLDVEPVRKGRNVESMKRDSERIATLKGMVERFDRLSKPMKMRTLEAIQEEARLLHDSLKRKPYNCYQVWEIRNAIHNLDAIYGERGPHREISDADIQDMSPNEAEWVMMEYDSETAMI
jgi:hypothetical protein